MGGISTLAPTFAPGSSFAGYRIEAVAGSGGMGIVYRATQVALGRPVALKLIAAQYAGDRAFRERFKREWETAASIDHPNVIPVYEAGEAEEHLFLAMRYVEGVDLAGLIAREPSLSPERVVRLVEQVAWALDAAHARGLVHRDVKPANVLIAGGDHVYLTDFGLTKRASSQSGMTKTGVFVGTLDYAAPEQIRGEAMDARTDVYSLGCVLFQALTRVPPFDRNSDVAKMYAHLSDPAPSVSAVRADAPAALDGVVARALAKDAADRYGSAGALAEAARAALRSAPADAAAAAGSRAAGSVGTARPRAAGPVAAAGPRAAGDTPPADSQPASGPAEDSPWPRRRRLALGITLPAVLVGGLAVAGLAATGVLGGGTAGAPPTVRAAATATPAAAHSAPPAPVATPPATTAQPHTVATIAVGRGPDGVTVSGGRVFVANQRSHTLSVVDPATNRVTGRPIDVGARPDGVVGGKGVVWVAGAGTDSVRRLQLDPEPVPTAKVAVGDRPEAISLGTVLVWVANRNDNTVNRIDRASPSVVGSPIGVGEQPAGIFVGRSSVWVTNRGDDTLTRIDLSTTQPVGEPIDVGAQPRGVIEAAGSVWIANAGDGTVTRLDLKGRPEGAPIHVGRNPRELAFGQGFVWVTNRDDNTVSRIDPDTGRVVGSAIPVGSGPLGIASGAGAIWVANHGDDTLTRIEP